MTNSVSSKLQASIIYEDTALEIWNDLKNRFAQTNGPRVFNLQKEISELHQGEMSITNFFTRLKVFWDQLQNLSLFPSYTYGKCMCNINKRLNDLQGRESMIKFLMGVNESFSQVRSQVLLMDQVNHVTNLVNSGGKGKDRPVCTHCGEIGHTVDKCYKYMGFLQVLSSRISLLCHIKFPQDQAQNLFH